MTIDEFRALKRGDRIRNAMSGSSGAVADVENHRGKIIVAIEWGDHPMQFHFGEQSTAWMHWALETAT
jgi:hypothetical protein